MSEVAEIRMSYAAARTRIGLTQKEVATIIGMSESTVMKYENGITVPKWNTHKTLSLLYKIPEYLLTPTLEE